MPMIICEVQEPKHTSVRPQVPTPEYMRPQPLGELPVSLVNAKLPPARKGYPEELVSG